MGGWGEPLGIFSVFLLTALVFQYEKKEFSGLRSKMVANVSGDVEMSRVAVSKPNWLGAPNYRKAGLGVLLGS